MFGYVKPFKPQLKICEFEAYKAVYCGLCGQLGKSFGAAARLTLSYDFTFLSMLQFSLSEEQPEIKECRCYVNPFFKTPCFKTGEPLRFGADIAAIMIYYKLLDNIADSALIGKIGWSVLRPFAAFAHKKAVAARPGAEELVAACMSRQKALEQSGCSNIDEASEPTAAAMAGICSLLTEDGRQKRILERLGYFLGRFVYLCDALDDMKDDLKTGAYNPLVLRYGLKNGDDLSPARQAAKESIYMTIGEAAKAYDLLEPKAFKPVLDNIIKLGMRASADSIGNTKAKNRE